MKKVFVSMYFDIEDDALEDIKRINSHVEELLDLDAWPEIESVYCVNVREIKENDE